MSSLLESLFQLSFLLQGRLSRIAAEHDLSIIQVRLLGILRDREPTMQALARHLELEKSSLSGLVDRAEARGLVERRASSEDRRASTVHMTTRGRQLSRTIVTELERDVAPLFATLDDKDADKLRTLVERITSSDSLDGRV